jgi:hypothetical protein
MPTDRETMFHKRAIEEEVEEIKLALAYYQYFFEVLAALDTKCISNAYIVQHAYPHA